MSTYLAEQRARDRARASRARKYIYQPAGWDLFHDHGNLPDPGQVVTLTQPYGAPKNGTFGQVYVSDTDGALIGLVDRRSLTLTRRAR